MGEWTQEQCSPVPASTGRDFHESLSPNERQPGSLVRERQRDVVREQRADQIAGDYSEKEFRKVVFDTKTIWQSVGRQGDWLTHDVDMD